jgi:ribosomal protein S18 acetylase RimI-like enzyme
MTARILEVPATAESRIEKDGIEIREAVASDNEALLELTRLTPMEGTIALRIDRDPDFFALPRARGEAVVFVATYGERVVGCMSAAIHAAYIGGVLEKIAHATDLKVHPEFNGRRLGVRLIRQTEAYLRGRGVDLTFSLVADGNQRVMRLSHGRHGTPVPVMLGRFFVDQLIASPFRVKSKRYRVEEAGPRDLPEIAEMLDRNSRERSFAPPVSVADLEGATAGAVPARFRKMLVVRESGRVIATLTIEDTQNLRQNVPIGLPWSIHLALAVLRLLTLPVPGLRIPRLGEPLAILYVRWMACAEGHEPALRVLLSEARVEAFHRRFIFVSVGLHERDPLRSAVAGLPRLTFTSLAMATSLIQPDRVQGLADRIPFEDFALV